MPKAKPIYLELDLIRLDGGTQCRAGGLDPAVVEEYALALDAEADFPPVEVVHDGTAYWLWSGFHRVAAARKIIGRETIKATITEGTQDDARWLALSANAIHGMRRTHADKRAAVLAALQHPSGLNKSDGVLADHCGVSQRFVSEVRKESSTQNSSESSERVGKDGRTYKVKPKAAEQPPDEDDEETTIVFEATPPQPDEVEIEQPDEEKLPPAPWDEKLPPELDALVDELRDLVEDGKMSVAAATIFVVLSPDDQRRLASHIMTGLRPQEAYDKVLDENNARGMPPPKPKPRKQTTKAEPLFDALGVPVPDPLRDTFGDPWLHDLIDQLNAAHAAIKLKPWRTALNGKSAPYGSYLRVTPIVEAGKDALHSIQAAIATVQAALPHAVCSLCKGAGCHECRNAGWMPKWRFDELTEQGML